MGITESRLAEIIGCDKLSNICCLPLQGTHNSSGNIDAMEPGKGESRANINQSKRLQKQDKKSKENPGPGPNIRSPSRPLQVPGGRQDLPRSVISSTGTSKIDSRIRNSRTWGSRPWTESETKDLLHSVKDTTSALRVNAFDYASVQVLIGKTQNPNKI